MSQSTELVRALLGEGCKSDADAELVLAAAAALGVDTLDWCMHRSGIDANEVLERGADWAGLAFSPMVPDTGGGHIEVRRLDNLAAARSIREKLYDREVIYIAPGFDELLRLKTYGDTHPDVRRTTCIAPAGAIRAALADLTKDQLLQESRQRLSRRWPFASAHLDLGRRARLLFVAGALLLALATALAPEIMQAILLPFVGAILMIPALFRLTVVLTTPGRTRRRAPPLRNGELPVYSVLIPLCDEAHMVPLLHRAMSALSYPVLWRCYT